MHYLLTMHCIFMSRKFHIITIKCTYAINKPTKYKNAFAHSIKNNNIHNILFFSPFNDAIATQIHAVHALSTTSSSFLHISFIIFPQKEKNLFKLWNEL